MCRSRARPSRAEARAQFGVDKCLSRDVDRDVVIGITACVLLAVLLLVIHRSDQKIKVNSRLTRLLLSNLSRPRTVLDDPQHVSNSSTEEISFFNKKHETLHALFLFFPCAFLVSVRYGEIFILAILAYSRLILLQSGVNRESRMSKREDLLFVICGLPWPRFVHREWCAVRAEKLEES